MTEEQKTRISKFLSKYLRHEPEALGLKLQPGGWVQVEELLAACDQKGMRVSRYLPSEQLPLAAGAKLSILVKRSSARRDARRARTRKGSERC